MPIPLSSTQLDLIYTATQVLEPGARDPFVRTLHVALHGVPEPVGDGQLWRLVREVQRQFWKPPPPEKPPVHHRRRVGEALP